VVKAIIYFNSFLDKVLIEHFESLIASLTYFKFVNFKNF
jgi:hypothetical protein